MFKMFLKKRTKKDEGVFWLEYGYKNRGIKNI